jgi:hypothetical protein
MLASEFTMKRIIDGISYNTDTSTRLAVSEYEVDYNHIDYPCVGTLYQTRGGAFFVHEQIDLGRDTESDELTLKDRFSALSAERAQTWMMTGDVEVFHNPFGEPPEAAAEAEPSATIYVRVPASLKQRLEQSAKAEKLSGNAWAIRCIERCLAPNESVRADIGLVWWLASSISTAAEEGTEDRVAERAVKIMGIVEHQWRNLGFAEDRFDQDISNLAVSNYYANETGSESGRLAAAAPDRLKLPDIKQVLDGMK